MSEHQLSDVDMPGFWKDADLASLKGQKWTLRYSSARLCGSVFAALGGVLSAKAGRLDLAALVILVGFMVALIAEVASWVHAPERAWYEGRACAESAKTLAWRYAVAADPFPPEMPNPEAVSLLRHRMEQVADGVSDRIVMESPNPVVTPRMTELRQAEFANRRAAYVKDRTLKQQEWYASKARFNAQRATGWRVLLVVAEVIALLVAALRVFGGWDVDLAGLMGAAIAAGAAWAAVKQFSPLAAAYSVAAKELAIQGDKLKDVPESDWPLVAADAEEAISREHTMWLASRTGRRPT